MLYNNDEDIIFLFTGSSVQIGSLATDAKYIGLYELDD